MPFKATILRFSTRVSGFRQYGARKGYVVDFNMYFSSILTLEIFVCTAEAAQIARDSCRNNLYTHWAGICSFRARLQGPLALGRVARPNRVQTKCVQTQLKHTGGKNRSVSLVLCLCHSREREVRASRSPTYLPKVSSARACPIV